jgi:oligoendopeptidase F
MHINPYPWIELGHAFRSFVSEDSFDLRICPLVSETFPAKMAEIAAIFGALLE